MEQTNTVVPLTDTGEMDEAIQEFLVESEENLSQVERDLVDLESHPEQQETLASIFRAIHTIKGTCSFLGYSKLESLAHSGETLLSLVRDGELPLTNDIARALLTMVDAVRHMLAAIEQTRSDGTEEYQDLKNVLVALQKGEAASVATKESGQSVVSSQSCDVQEVAPVSAEDSKRSVGAEPLASDGKVVPVSQTQSAVKESKVEPLGCRW